MSVTRFKTWQALVSHRETLMGQHLRELFQKDEQRLESLSLAWEGLYYDFSKQRVTQETLALLRDLAREAQVPQQIGRMFSGAHINTTEDRAVLHVALRASQSVFPSERDNVMPEVIKTRERMVAFAEALRSGQRFGHEKMPIRDVVNIGIGGSDLGPKMMAYALRAIAHPTLSVHFVSNLDSAQLAPLLQSLDPRTTLFVIVSKTFTTQETLFNARTARDWLRANLGERVVLQNHFAAVSSRPERAVEFGVHPELVFPIWDWVGGRYSLWSAVGLGLMIAVGPHAFQEMLNGAEKMDQHFISAPLEKNLPVTMALLGFWNTALLGAGSLALLPYNESLKYFPSFLQQLEMESNGKSVSLNGEALDSPACPIIWGELGNNGQHAFFQLLHQGGRLVPCDFIAAVRSDYPLPEHQEALLSNCFAQTAALAFGKTQSEVRAEMKASGLPEAEVDALVPHRTFAGNQPSSTLLLSALTPFNLGALVALYEHKVFVQGVLWGVNSFDQWGVELGKAMASQILPAMRAPERAAGFDASTRGLLAFCAKYLG